MENGSEKKWNFDGKQKQKGSSVSVRGAYNMLMEKVKNRGDKKPLIRLCRVDPTDNPLYRTSLDASQAVATAVHSYNYNSYSPTVGLPDAKRAIANYLSADLPYQLSPENVFITVGGTQAVDIILPVLARPGANILLPRPGYPQYDSRASCCNLEVRHFDLLPERGWEVDLDSLEAVADHKTVAMVLINPSNPCGNVFTYQHLKRVAEVARKLGIFVVSDEVYAHITYGSNPFVPMGVFSSIVPVITIGSLSKRWLVPGWRIGWIATCDPHGIFHKTGLVKNMIDNLEISTDLPTILQAAIPDIIGKTKDDFFVKNLSILRETANKFYDLCKEIPCLTCPNKPEGAMSVLVKINFSQIKDIIDDMDFCAKLAEEESVILLPGVMVGLKNWVRISFAVDPSDIVDGFSRIKAFCLRYAKMS
ncbi:tyrosine aminotransferase [Vigna unguiculata]|uniref:Tyrosine aminotransferase n=1 Tax=Vigna unguiculata TaxID=3917 RepID=A0A4D6L002_VIGUN|nr:tyrosine aminotransferase [Vigna unguiculata]